MKNRILTLSTIICTAILYYFVASAFSSADKTASTGNGGEIQTLARDTFTNCIFNTGYNVMLVKPKLNLFDNLDSFKALNFNTIQWYDWQGSSQYGKYDSSLSQTQIDNFNAAIGTVNSKGLSGFYERSYLSYYCYGQRLIYEVKPYNDTSSVNNGFVYGQCMEDTYTTDGNRTVLHASPSANSEGYICRGIYENLQHTDLYGFRQSDEKMWYLKPVMRIDTNVHDTTRVVRIEIVPFDELSPVKTITIKAENFKNGGVYNGDYIERYNLALGNLLEIDGDHATAPCLSKGYNGEWWNWDNTCKVDFRVYWYGECDVWFDKMIVDDERANYLFDTTNQNLYINPRIQQEVTSFANTQGNYSFFVDEVVMSQIPCMKYVFDKMRYYNPKSKISFALTNALHIKGLKNDDLSYGMFFDSLKPDFVQLDAHKFIKFLSSDIGIPDVIAPYDLLIPSGWYESVSTYNNKLQNKIFGYKSENPPLNDQGSLIYEIYKLRNSNTNPVSNIKYIIQPHIHGYLFNTGGNPYFSGLREPTNEEIQAQATLSIAHGADGLCWYIYGSEVGNLSSNHKTINGFDGLMSYSPNLDTILYTYALLDTNYTHRHKNCYNQDKWTYVSEMNGKILKWAEVLNNADWVDGFSVHQEGANHYYINDIKSKAPLIPGANSECLNEGLYEYYDCPEYRYWELGFFTPKDASDIGKYFMAVNRRCVPETGTGIGDVRALKIKFNALDTCNWVISDVNTGQKLNFDSRNPGPGGYLNLGENPGDIGYFKPGEGKLFRLVPAKHEGGTLVSDETISGNVTCRGKIYSNGYNITINQGATITFTDTAGIEMNGGVFTCGVNADNADAVTLQKTSVGSGWGGLSLNNCSSVGIYNTFINEVKANDTAKAVSLSNCPIVYLRRNTFTSFYNTGAVQSAFTTSNFDSVSLRIKECNFNMGQSGYS